MEDQILEYIWAYTEFVGFPPTFQEIADGCDASKSTVVWYLERLVASGQITKKANVPRSIAITEGHLTFSRKPGIIGQILE